MSRNTKITLGIIAAIVVIGAAVGGALVLLGDDEAEADEVFLEPVDDEGEDPFTDDVSVDAEFVDAEQSGSTNGNEPGLYGGTRNNTSCDRDQLIDFLQDNEDKGRAWAGVLDIEFDEIEDYVNDLTPVLLRGDTRVHQPRVPGWSGQPHPVRAPGRVGGAGGRRRRPARALRVRQPVARSSRGELSPLRGRPVGRLRR